MLSDNRKIVNTGHMHGEIIVGEKITHYNHQKVVPRDTSGVSSSITSWLVALGTLVAAIFAGMRFFWP